jgi:hypothetical protein
MQIHEITYSTVTEGILKTIGQDIKGAVTAPFQKAAAVLNTPDATTDPQAYRDAMNKYRAGQVAQLEPRVQQQLSAQVAQKTQQRAKELAQSWTDLVKSKKPAGRLKSAPTPLKPTGQYATKPAPGTTVNMDPDAVAIQEQATPGAPTPAELAAYQAKLSAASQPPRTGFAAVSGPTLPGGTVRSQVTARPKTILTGTRAKEFKSWAGQQLASKIPGTNQTITVDQVIQKYPDIKQQLNTTLTNIIRGNNDPKAVEQYFTIAMQGMQKLSAELKQSGAVSRSGAVSTTQPGGVLSRYVDPVVVQKLQDLAKSPAYAEILKKELGI